LQQISEVLVAKAAEGVSVRLMVDEIGQAFDKPTHAFQNIALFEHLRSHGVQVDIYRPASPLHINNRLHCKIVAIDNRIAFLGGSNIGDYYTTWSDSNLRRLALIKRFRFTRRFRPGLADRSAPPIRHPHRVDETHHRSRQTHFHTHLVLPAR
jgi:phosphatidylserine/phosphatidylglycerophosphate/cardiolipin synthase-like enzyme